VELRYDPSNIIHILAYTVGDTESPSRCLGVLKSRDRREEKLSLKSLRFEQRIIREEEKARDKSSIHLDELERNEFVEKKIREKKKQIRRKEHEQTGRSEGLTNVISIDRKEEQKKESNLNQKGGGKRPSQKLEPKRTAEVVVSDWNQHSEEDWY
jgi:hypothetical protein